MRPEDVVLPRYCPACRSDLWQDRSVVFGRSGEYGCGRAVPAQGNGVGYRAQLQVGPGTELLPVRCLSCGTSVAGPDAGHR